MLQTVRGDARSTESHSVALASTEPVVIPDPATAPRPIARSLRGRAAGAAAMRRCLELQAGSPAPLGPVGRLLGRDPLGPLAREAFAEALAEARVARTVDGLASWIVLHSLPVAADGGDLAHLLVGPAGAVLLVTRDSRGHRVHAAGDVLGSSAGDETAVLDALTLREDVGARLGVALGRHVPVSAAVVLVGSDPATIERTSVPVLFLDQLRAWLAHLPAALEADEVAALAAAAESADVWRPRPSSELSDPVELAAFRRLEGDVRHARTRRAAWAVAGIAAAVVVVFGSAAGGSPGTLLRSIAELVIR